MSRESFIIQFNGASSMIKKNKIPVARCVNLTMETFSNKTSNCEELLSMLWRITSKSDDVSVETFVKTMQHLDNLYFKTGELNGQVIITAAFFSLDSSYDYSLDSKEVSDFFKRIGDKKNSKKIKEYIKQNDENGDGVLQLDEFLGAFDSIYKINSIPINDYLKVIEFTDFSKRYDLLPKKKGKALQEDVVQELIKDIPLNERKGIETQLSVLILLSSKDKKTISREEYVKVRREINYIKTKIGRITTEVLMTCTFRTLDKSCSASLDNNDLTRMLKASGMESKKKVVLQYINDLDENGDGVLQLDEMLSILKVFVNKHTFDIEKYLKNLDARVPADIVECSFKEPIKIPNNNFIVNDHLTSNDSEQITFALFDATIKCKLGESYSTSQETFKFLFFVADIHNQGFITKTQFSLIMKFLDSTNGKIENDPALCRICFQLQGKKEIGVDDLQTLCSKMGQPFSSEQEAINELVMYDDNRNGLIDENEFVYLMTEDDELKMDDSIEEHLRKNARKAIKLFRVYDTNRDGLLNETEVGEIFITQWHQCSPNNQKAIHIGFLKNQQNDFIDENRFVVLCQELEASMNEDDSGEINIDKLLTNFFYFYVPNGSNLMDKETLEKVLIQFKLPSSPIVIQKLLTSSNSFNMITFENFSKYISQHLQ
ncbi:EF-hand calcium-binding domain containing protein [Entamoeba nuttalli P19]|uniref:EF-hand calcium-binding domain containing protein n=1 Tax=Entamoeba nuttalli (strain P19) TaxID=1076696 RepID=K2GA08_ENTNP|nr:EF-hand calcium-binding domain containing protein [Entamoeba nuttalli P19]EKE39291.1 EF-hand calcium-binding domain containing protein [Entamoeba nuttalli P19]|eukprot:XP_008858368.1 EF-hand calcium-binding domain containing protein [Entamoeba nuttalli P19]